MKQLCLLTLVWFCSTLAIQQEQTHFVVVMAGRNNRDVYKRALDSVFSQKYKNFEVIICDDNSEDGSDQLIYDYIIKNGYENKATLIINSFRRYKIANIYNAIHRCNDTDVIVIVDTDDYLAHDGVLTYLNSVYTTNDVWITCGGHQRLSNNRNDITIDPEMRTIWALRSFYAWLFKSLPLELFLYQCFLKSQSDYAKIHPMQIFARDHYLKNNQILYVYDNLDGSKRTDLKDGPKDLTLVDGYNWKKKFSSLKKPKIPSNENCTQNKKIDLFLFSNNLLTLEHTPTDIGSVIVISDTTNLKQSLTNKITELPSEYILCLNNTNSIAHLQKPLNYYVRILERTQAYAIRVKDHNTNLQFENGSEYICDTIWGWKEEYSPVKLHRTQTLDGFIYRKKDFLEMISKINFENLEILKQELSKVNYPEHSVFLAESNNFDKKLYNIFFKKSFKQKRKHI